MESKPPKPKHLHYDSPGIPHGLTFSCYKYRSFLNYRRPRMYLINSLEKARINHNFDLWAYVIMPNHVHLVIFPKNNDYSIPEILNSIKLPAAKMTLHWMGVNMPEILRLFATDEKMQPYRFWLDAGGYDRNLRDQDELVKFVKYVHDNPVRKGLVEDPTQWYWSSAGDWLNDVKGPIRIDKDSFPVL